MFGKVSDIVMWIPRRLLGLAFGAAGCSAGCLLLLALLAALACGLLFLAINQVSATAPVSSSPLAVYLLIDNSNSMFDKDGIGSDPALLRIEAARLFISYLGVDDGALTHACSVLFFGGEAGVTVPMTPLSSDQRRAEIFSLIAQPGRMRWTDHSGALALVLEDMDASAAAGRQPAIVLLTDGKPEWDDTPSTAEIEAYSAQLRQQGATLNQAGIPLFIILLANEATDADPDIANTWQPVWQEMSHATPGGRFYSARQAEDLAGIYHDIVVALSGSETAGPVVIGDVGPAGLREEIQVEADLARLTLVVRKSQPEMKVTILQPDGVLLSAPHPSIRHAGQPGITTEEIWVIDEPAPGSWAVLADGQGRVIVWKDYRPKPTPTTVPTPAPTAAPTLAPTSVPTPVVTPADIKPAPVAIAPTPEPTIISYNLPAAARMTAGANQANPWYWLLLAPLGLTFILAGYGYRRLRGSQGIVEGELHVISGPGPADGRSMVELDELAQTSITVGASPADIPLTGAEQRITLRPGSRLGDGRQILISGPPEAQLDGRPLEGEQPISDMATITLGPNELQYQNLRLGSAVRAMLAMEEEQAI